jgi:nicotinate dehydrogenase subunit A
MPKYDFRVNGKAASVESWDPDQPLLYVLRNTLGVHGCKFGCGLGQCGACTVLIDGKAARACLTPVKLAAGRSITTEASAAVQAAFVAEEAAQCGYCTNGMAMTATALLASNPKPTREEVKSGLAGNLCRCGTHTRILSAVLRAASTHGGAQ